MGKLLVLHRALAPYRVDLMRELVCTYGADLYFTQSQPTEQPFREESYGGREAFPFQYLPRPGRWLPKNYRPQLTTILQQKPYNHILLNEINLLTMQVLVWRQRYAPQATVSTICDDNEQVAQELLRASLSPKKLLLKRGAIDRMIMCDERAMRLYAAAFPKVRFHIMPIVQCDSYLRSLYAAPQHEAPIAALRRAWLGTKAASGRILLYVGRLSREKNLPALLRAALQVLRPDERLVCVGEGEERAVLERLAEAGKGRILLTGKLEGATLWQHYAAADGFVLPSTREAFGAVVPEALMAGLPVLVSEVAGAAPLSVSSGGMLIRQPDNEELLGEDIARFMAVLPKWKWPRQSHLSTTFKQEMERLVRFLSLT